MRRLIDDLLEFVDQLVIVPRVCEHCWCHQAVIWEFDPWPDTYLCRCCLEARIARRVPVQDTTGELPESGGVPA